MFCCSFSGTESREPKEEARPCSYASQLVGRACLLRWLMLLGVQLDTLQRTQLIAKAQGPSIEKSSHSIRSCNWEQHGTQTQQLTAGN